MKWNKLIGIAIVLSMVATVFAALPVSAVDPQSVRDRCYDAADGAWMTYAESPGGPEGWTFYWWDNTAKGIHRQDPLKSATYSHGGAPPFTAVTIAADTQYPDPAGWLYNSRALICQENASSGNIGWSFTNSTGGTSPYTMLPYVRAQKIPFATSATYAWTAPANIVLNWNNLLMYDDLGTLRWDLTCHRAGYLVYRSTTNATWNQNPLMRDGDDPVVSGAVGDWTLVGGTVAAPITGTTWTDVGRPVGTYYYSIKIVLDGTATPGGAATNVASLYGGWGSIAEVVSSGAATYPPAASAVLSTPATHNGNTVTKYVNVTATITEPDAAHTVGAAEFQVETSPGVWSAAVNMSAVDGAFNGLVENVYGIYNFPPILTEGVHAIRVHGWGTVDYWNATYAAGSFTLDDTTSPLCVYAPANPPNGASRAIGSPVSIYATYTDHTNYSVATLAYGNATAPGYAWTTIPMTWMSTAYGCYIVGLTANFIVFGAPGQTISYIVNVTDSALPAPNPRTSSATQTIIPFAAASQPQDPYPIFGFTYQYNGVAGGAYTPTLIAGCTVTVAWQNTSIAGSPYTTSFATVLGSQYSKSILNYTEGTIVYTNVTVNPVYAGSLGYNYTTIETLTFPGGRVSNITCGVPYNVLIMQPIIGANLIIASPFAIEYQIVDRNGVRAPGYYTLNLAVGGLDGPLDVVAGHMINPVYGYTNPLGDPKTFNGLADPDPGHYLSATMALNFPPGVWWINATEGGITEADLYLTPWDVWYVDPLNTLNGWLKDYDNITVNVAGGGFDWRLTTGWNLVSCPQAGTYRAIPGVNPYFDAQDALNWTNLYMFATYGVYDRGLSMANRTGGNPSAYASYDLDTGEAAAFGIDYRIGYWVFVSIATAGFPGGNAIIHFDSVNATENAGVNLVTYDLAAGWNLMGFQHNFTGVAWCAGLTASDYTDGTVSAPLNIAGALTKIVLTQWPAVAQKWYIDYVVTDWFPGMAPLNWVWDGTYSPNPGNGFWIWVNAATTYTYNPTVVL